MTAIGCQLCFMPTRYTSNFCFDVSHTNIYKVIRSGSTGCYITSNSFHFIYEEKGSVVFGSEFWNPTRTCQASSPKMNTPLSTSPLAHFKLWKS